MSLKFRSALTRAAPETLVFTYLAEVAHLALVDRLGPAG
jgi:hypothetical protein